jgi:tetratricopeptide (TPR) repeat protein
MLFSIFKHVLRRNRSRRAAEGEPIAAAQLQHARTLRDTGDVGGAHAACEGILSQDPAHAGAHSLLGALYGEKGDLDRALTHFTEAVRLAPGSEEANLGLGNVHRLRNAPEAAAASYRRVLAINAGSPAAHFSLGLVLRQFGQFGAAAEHFRRAFSLAPDFAEAAKECALCQIHHLGAHEAAISVLTEALEYHSEAGELHAALGLAHQKMHRPQMALQCYEKARSLGHIDAEFFSNLGYVLQELGRLPEAFSSYDQATALQPDFPVARFHRALARLLTGDYAHGWPEYEIRLVSEDKPRRPEAYARWKGEPLTGRTILVWGEQGLGDEIMFASCLPQVVNAAGRCIVECSPKLEALFRRSFPGARVYAAEPDRSIPAAIKAESIDCETPIGSLPLYLRRSAQDFPQHHGYLRADSERIAMWRQRLSSLGCGLTVGVSWQGGTHLTRSPLRSVPLSQWLPIFDAEDTCFISLQYGDAAAALDEFASQHGKRVAHWQEAIDDYDETAALVSALDLVISVQTAVVHLAGALGRPAWVMVPSCPEWRYGFAGESMRWYPSARVFRQSSLGEWQPVIATVARELHELERRAKMPS